MKAKTEMKFFYTALTADNKKATGILDLPSREAAQAELHKMGAAILSVREITDQEFEKFQKEQNELRAKKGIKTFGFLALDPNAKKIEGTIDSPDDYSAYKRLRLEYRFKVLSLFPAEAGGEEKSKSRLLMAGFEDRFSKENARLKKDEPENRKTQELSDVEIDREMVAQVDRVIVNIRKTLEKHGGLYSNDMLIEIRNTLNELERLRSSNNIRHITELSNALYGLISRPDKTDGPVADTEYNTLMKEVGESALVKKEFALYKKAAAASGAMRALENISGYLRRIRNPGRTELEKKQDTSGPFFKKTLRKDLAAAFKSLFTKRSTADPGSPSPSAPEKITHRRDFTGFFVELDSFTGWLLCFYIFYFFLADFSIEKNFGLNRDFLYRTLKTPLLLNIALFLLILHFTLRLRNLHFRHQAIGSFFLFCLTMGAYVILIANF